MNARKAKKRIHKLFRLEDELRKTAGSVKKERMRLLKKLPEDTENG